MRRWIDQNNSNLSDEELQTRIDRTNQLRKISKNRFSNTVIPTIGKNLFRTNKFIDPLVSTGFAYLKTEETIVFSSTTGTKKELLSNSVIRKI